jgi:hypothetical protein
MSQTTERAFEAYVEEILLTEAVGQSGTNAEWDNDRQDVEQLEDNWKLIIGKLHPSKSDELSARPSGDRLTPVVSQFRP